MRGPESCMGGHLRAGHCPTLGAELTLFSPHLFTDLLLLTGLASSVFILSELLKLCERVCSAARKAQVHQEDM